MNNSSLNAGCFFFVSLKQWPVKVFWQLNHLKMYDCHLQRAFFHAFHHHFSQCLLISWCFGDLVNVWSQFFWVYTGVVHHIEEIVHSRWKFVHPRCRWVCFFIRTNLEKCCSAMDPLQWMGAVRMRVQTADKNITIIHTTPVINWCLIMWKAVCL